MTNKEVIIDDMQKTIERLQKECTEKTDNIIALSEQLQRKEQECERLKSELDSAEFCVCPTTDDYIKEIAETIGMTDVRLSGGKYFYTSLKDEIIQRIKNKKQECKQKSWELGNLGYKIKNQRKEINNRLAQIGRLQAENEELKEKLDNIQDDCPSFGDCSYVQCAKDERDRYKQALEKIKEIAAEINLTIMGGNASPKDEWVELYTNTCLKIILIINEVLKDE